MPNALRRTGSWGGISKPREATESHRETEPPPSARGEITGSELWKEEAAANGFDPNLLFTRSDSKKSLGGEPLTRTRSRENLAVGDSEKKGADSGGAPLTRKKSNMSGALAGIMSPAGGQRATRSKSDLALSRIESLGSVDVSTLMDMGVLDDTILRRGTTLVRTRSQERLAQACKDLGFNQEVLQMGGQPAQRINSRGMQGVNLASQALVQGRQADLSMDLFGLDNHLAMGTPTAATTQGPLSGKRAAVPAAISPSRPAKRPNKGDGISPSKRGQDRAAAAAEEASRTPTGVDPWVMRNVKLKRGKYEGRTAYVLGKTSKKYQVQVEGVPYQLEFYSTMFCLPEHYKQPKGRKKKKPMDGFGGQDALGFGLTRSLDDLPPDVLSGTRMTR